MSILWKEWRQQRLIFVLGCGLGVVFPVFDLLQRSRHGWGGTLVGSGIVACCGALYALILGVATTQDDVRRGVSEFWQSRPVRPQRIFTTKLLLAAGLLLAVFLCIECLDLAYGDYWGSRRTAWNILTVTWPIALLLFSASMFFTALMRDSAKSVMAALWLGLLIYCLPLLANSLGWMNVFNMLYEGGREQPSILMDIVAPMLRGHGQAAGQAVSQSVAAPVRVVHTSLSGFVWRILGSPDYLRYLVFVAAMTTGVVACLALSTMAVKRQWRWQPGQKTLAWTIGLSAALIFSLAMFQVGHNLEPATTYNGRWIDPTLRFASQAAHTYDWAASSPSEWSLGYRQYSWGGARICTDGQYLYTAASYIGDSGTKDALVYDGQLDICQFPGTTGTAAILSRTRFAAARRLPMNMHRAITVHTMVVKDGRLFLAYQVYLPAEGEAQDFQAASQRNPEAAYSRDPAGEFSLRVLVADVSDPAIPRRIADEEVDRSRTPVSQDKGDSVYGQFCYLWGQKDLLVVSLADAEHPKVVRKISIGDFGLHAYGPRLIQQVSVVNDKLLCVGPLAVLLLDLADPQAPRMVFRRFLESIQWEEAIFAALYADDLLYLSMGSGLEIYRLSPTPSGELHDELVGRRRTTPLERLAGRRPHELMLRQKYLYEADERFGVLVYDVTDPSRPHRAYHAGSDDYIQTIGTLARTAVHERRSWYADACGDAVEGRRKPHASGGDGGTGQDRVSGRVGAQGGPWRGAAAYSADRRVRQRRARQSWQAPVHEVPRRPGA